MSVWGKLFLLMSLFLAEQSWAAADGDKIELDVCGQKSQVELALSDAARNRGYMYREEAPQGNQGMLFVFSDDAVRSFWMANVRFPLDILFLDHQKRVIKILTMAPELRTPPHLLKHYSSEHAARYALEMRAGWFREKKLTLGCPVVFPSGWN